LAVKDHLKKQMKYITSQYSKYLESLKKEIALYENESDLWKLWGAINNTPANLAMHICGNLRHNIGAVIGKDGYIRDRGNEFRQKGTAKQAILDEIENTGAIVLPIIESLTPEQLKVEFPETSHGEEQTVYDALIRLAFHLAYHVGQINYHRRLLTVSEK